MNRFLIVIPSFNEEQNIGKVLQGLLAMKLKADILVVDDGSRDRTAMAASTYPVKVISHPYNLGYGAALQTGYKYATAKGYEFILQFDADDQHNPEDLKPIMQELERRDVDIVMGSRYLEGGSTFKIGPIKKFGVCFFHWLIKTLTGVKISDPTSGLRGISQSVFHYYSVSDRFPADFPDADILIQMILLEYRIREIPAHMRMREVGVSMHAGIKPLLYIMKVSLSIMTVLIQFKLTKKVSYHE
ncbi:glycosyl transferase family 2 [Aneurinibacillus soli]|uniref:Undecaprenyl-phosphate mannosyltransferase n=1 Tax=Aneurinibacillus soli TaxID=1500254 RepID=A0A0U4WN67_9BACL|nr:glycosyltransferase family 2 protein [Aneurinibacillus soli]PYE61891.1 glycosyl transferase family 2 [Aneurinibacillus soli]BAU29707.1 Undecaprenyl-phosphate mannosyltransferase [Aneurinibacillus soli]